jgi:hypothetical protein
VEPGSAAAHVRDLLHIVRWRRQPGVERPKSVPGWRRVRRLGHRLCETRTRNGPTRVRRHRPPTLSSPGERGWVLGDLDHPYRTGSSVVDQPPGDPASRGRSRAGGDPAQEADGDGPPGPGESGPESADGGDVSGGVGAAPESRADVASPEGESTKPGTRRAVVRSVAWGVGCPLAWPVALGRDGSRGGVHAGRGAMCTRFGAQPVPTAPGCGSPPASTLVRTPRP